ncbi:hypothetical protein BDZ45DRAFT_681128 [Acephala macrosclerotiorum]|nr:hypothetical protein BDZ45DRAFT_681128 [Acephala macrosclerotiorum]
MNAILQLFIPTPKTFTKGRNTTRDKRLRAQTLFFDANWDIPQIALQLNLTSDQVKYALRYRLTPQKTRSRKRLFLGPAERKQLIEWNCTEYAIATAFRIERRECDCNGHMSMKIGH